MKTTKPASIAVTTIMAMTTGPPSSLTAIKPAILCLHGRQQNAATFALKISGARKKLSRIYECDFLDGPILIPPISHPDNTAHEGRAWWEKNESGSIVGIQEAFDHVSQHVRRRREEGRVEYCAILGFSQGGTLAASLAIAGGKDIIPNVQAVITSGSPMVEEAVEYASSLRRRQRDGSGGSPVLDFECLPAVQMLHFAGETDAMVSIESTERLSEVSGVGEVRIHDRGHMFPTRSADVRAMLEFLERHVVSPK